MATKVVCSNKNKNNYVDNTIVAESADDIMEMIHNTPSNEFIHLHSVAGDDIYILTSSIILIEGYKPMNKKIICFLAGGITDCNDWKKKVINNINQTIHRGTDNLVIINPTNWKYKYLTNIDIFSIYFCNTPESDRSINFYELGRYATLMKQKYDDFPLRIIISCECGFKEAHKVLYQINNISCHIPVCLNSNPQDHARRIVEAYRRLGKKR